MLGMLQCQVLTLHFQSISSRFWSMKETNCLMIDYYLCKAQLRERGHLPWLASRKWCPSVLAYSVVSLMKRNRPVNVIHQVNNTWKHIKCKVNQFVLFAFERGIWFTKCQQKRAFAIYKTFQAHSNILDMSKHAFSQSVLFIVTNVARKLKPQITLYCDTRSTILTVNLQPLTCTKAEPEMWKTTTTKPTNEHQTKQ